VLVFLNQDTVPLPGWLDGLVGSLNDTVGIAGAKLLYPDGSLQHTGVSVDFKRPMGQEAVNYQTEQPEGVVDAVTGACLAIPRVLFHQLGGFDEGFRNGYEDVDLCLAARALGKLVWYNPDAEVIHHESISGPERFANVGPNVQLLRDKWDKA